MVWVPVLLGLEQCVHLGEVNKHTRLLVGAWDTSPHPKSIIVKHRLFVPILDMVQVHPLTLHLGWWLIIQVSIQPMQTLPRNVHPVINLLESVHVVSILIPSACSQHGIVTYKIWWVIAIPMTQMCIVSVPIPYASLLLDQLCIPSHTHQLVLPIFDC